jgi:hypothetical protein
MFRAFALTLGAFSLGLGALSIDAPPARAQGNCPNCDLPPGCRGNGNQNGKGNGNKNKNCQRLDIVIESDIDFGRVVILRNGSGQVILDLATGRRTLIGDIDDLGGMPITGKAVITGAPSEQVVIDMPGRIPMRDATGGQAYLSNFETDIAGFPTLDSDGRLEFQFSGTLVLDSDDDASGNLRGRIPITVEYP